MKLYYTKGACSLAVRIIINETGTKCEFESVDLKAKKTESGNDFLSINSKGAVPALQINGDVLTENAVLLQYVAEQAQATTLFPPANDLKHYRILEWLNYVATELHKGIGALFNPNLPQDTKDKVTIPLIKSKMKFIDNHLSKNKYLMGDQFTLPDAYLFVMITWLINFKFDISEWPNAERFFNEMKNRESVKKSLEQEGLK